MDSRRVRRCAFGSYGVCATRQRSTRARIRARSRTTIAPSSNTPRRCERILNSRRRGWRSIGRSCAPRTALPARPAARRHRPVRGGAGRVQLAAGVEPDQRRRGRELRETRNALRAKVAVAERGQDRARDADRPDARHGPAGLDLPEDVKLPSRCLQRRERAPCSPTIAQVRQHQPRLRSAFRDAPITIDLRNATLARRADVGRRRRPATSIGSPRRARSRSFPTRRRNAASTKRKSSARSI